MCVKATTQLSSFAYTKSSNMDFSWGIGNFIYRMSTEANHLRCMLECSNLSQCAVVSFNKVMKTCKMYLKFSTSMTYSENTDLYAKTPAISCRLLKIQV